MVDFDKDRDANLLAFERTGGAAANGLTVRDYFAAKAMQALLSRQGVFDFAMYKDDPWRCAAWAYDAADAMMRERDSQPRQTPTVEEAFGLEK